MTNITDLGYPLGTTSEVDKSAIHVGQPTLPANIAIDANEVFKTGVIGSVTDAIGSSIKGINHRQTPGAIQLNKDFFGLTFFTRPDLNLTWGNVKDVRQLAPLLTRESNSIPGIIRSLLDIRLYNNNTEYGGDSDLVDQRQAFIPMLTNHLLSISGWPDAIAPTMTSQEGMYKEAFSMVDGIVANYSTYDIQANFRNIPGDPITLLFLMWIHYASNVFQGNMVPYPDNIVMNQIDYQTRIYRLVLDSSKTYVKKIAACGASFPMSSPIGAAFNYEHNTPISDSNHQISIPFRCMGFMAQDDILISEFNATTAIFNPYMDKDATSIENALFKLTTSKNKYSIDDYNNARSGDGFIKLNLDELPLANNMGYPHININTYELGWYLDLNLWNAIFA